MTRKIQAPIIAVDFDGTIAQEDGEWHGKSHFGEPVEGAVEYLTKLYKDGWYIIIHTCRISDPEGDDGFMMWEWLDEHDLGFVKINDVSHNPDDASKQKPTADVYVDNKDWRQGGKQFDRRTWRRLYYKVSETMSDRIITYRQTVGYSKPENEEE